MQDRAYRKALHTRKRTQVWRAPPSGSHGRRPPCFALLPCSAAPKLPGPVQLYGLNPESHRSFPRHIHPSFITVTAHRGLLFNKQFISNLTNLGMGISLTGKPRRLGCK